MESTPSADFSYTHRKAVGHRGPSGFIRPLGKSQYYRQNLKRKQIIMKRNLLRCTLLLVAVYLIGTQMMPAGILDKGDELKVCSLLLTMAVNYS
jgi:hypothetical protein